MNPGKTRTGEMEIIGMIWQHQTLFATRPAVFSVARDKSEGFVEEGKVKAQVPAQKQDLQSSLEGGGMCLFFLYQRLQRRSF